jgi:hypothetical protein
LTLHYTFGLSLEFSLGKEIIQEYIFKVESDTIVYIKIG